MPCLPDRYSFFDLFRRSAWLVAVATLAIAFPSGVRSADLSKLPPSAKKQIDFVRDIQPIFASRCYECHGPSKQEAEFRLDVKAVALKGGELGVAIVPGKSSESLLIQFVGGLVEGKVMPRKGERLSADQIGLLRAWIDQGANWPDGIDPKNDKRNHWAFKPPMRAQIPPVKNKKWPRNPIDNFVLARLEKEKLKPSPEADRVTLIRRVSLDLTGLPPTPKEVDEFVADRSPDAYEKVVERLLVSPHYGERSGRHWLDAARYADTNGYEKDRQRTIWPYRDWVINAFNGDMSFDQFTIEQLAGDLLPKPTLQQRIATGFLRNSMLNQEGGIEPEQFRHEAMVDRVEAVGKAWLGLTIQCAQCHNHKYDPISQKEYYQMFAFLNNDDEAFLEVPTATEEKKRKEILQDVRQLEDKAMHSVTNLAERMAVWENAIVNPASNWTVLDPKEWINFATKFEKQSDHSLLGGGDLQPGGTMKVWIETPLTNITGFRLEALTNPNLIYGGPGLLGRGSFLIKEFTVEAYPLIPPGGTAVTNLVKFVRATADMEAPGFSVTNMIDGNTNSGWGPSVTPDFRNQNHVAVFECQEPVGFPGGTKLLITLHETFTKGEDKKSNVDKESNLDCHMLGCFRLSAITNSGPLNADPLSAPQRKWLALPPAKRTPKQTRELFNVFRLSDAAFAVANTNIDKAWANWPYPPVTLVVQQRTEPRITHIYKRGDRLRPGDEVQPDVPGVLHSFPEKVPRNRLGLARWIADKRNPTTARVIVNRIWQEYFGQGFITTPEDFGVRADAASHPELLDWLACEFMSPTRSSRGNEALTNIERGTWNAEKNQSLLTSAATEGWSIKHIHRLIVTSATYRQSSKVAPKLYASDPYNRLLARGPRFRVEAEVVQDIALSASGLLNPKIGGPSVYPPIPGNVADQVYGGFSWPESKGPDRYRRGMYTFWKRSLPFPALSAFDTPSGETSCTRRTRSNTPLQALTTLNERTFVEAAQAMAVRVVKEGGTDERNRASYAFRLCTGRKPSPSELESLLKFWREQYDYFENRTAAAVAVALPDPKQMPADLNLHKVAAWAMVSRAILNLDETITKE